MWIKKLKTAVLALLVFVGGAVFGQERDPIDLVLLLDTSSGMSQYYERINHYLTGSFLRDNLRLRDTFHLIAFSDRPRLEIARRVEGRGDLETIIARMLLMYPLEPGGDLSAAFSYAEDYVENLSPLRQRKLLILSREEGLSLEEARRRLEQRRASLERINPANLPDPPASRPVVPASPAPAFPAQRASEPPASPAPPPVSVLPEAPAARPATPQTTPSAVERTAAPVREPVPAPQPEAAAPPPLTRPEPPPSRTSEPLAVPQPVPEPVEGPPTAADPEPAVPEFAISAPAFPADPEPVPPAAAAPEPAISVSDPEPVPQPVAEASASPRREPRPSREPGPLRVFFVGLAAAFIGNYRKLLAGFLVLAALGLGFFLFRRLPRFLNRATVKAARGREQNRKVALVEKAPARSPEPYRRPPSRKSPYTADKDRVLFKPEYGSPFMLKLFVEDQNILIGKRNTHLIKPGFSYTVGGGRSDFLIFLVSVPPRIGEVKYESSGCTFYPRKPRYFPDIGHDPVPDCIGKTIRIVSDRGYELSIRLEPYEDPLLELNRLMLSIRVPSPTGA